jgi:hypothetical protein
MKIRPPYHIAAIGSGRVKSAEEMALVTEVDKLVKFLNVFKRQTNLSDEEVYAMVEKHVDAADHYYSALSDDELAKLLLVEEIVSDIASDITSNMKGGDDNE